MNGFTFATFPILPIVDGRCGCSDPDCKSAGKHPAERWKDIPPGRPEIVASADQGVGIATGARSGVFVVDLDVKNGIDGAANFAALGPVPPTYSVATPTGGVHLYFKHPGFPVRNSGPKQNPIAPGVDIRGDGGYVVAPGSPHKNGGMYTVAVDAPIADAPSWLLAWPGLKPSASEPAASDRSHTETGPLFENRPDAVARATAWLAKAEAAVSEQGGHPTAFRIIERAVRGFDLSESEAMWALQRWNARCRPPWSTKELLHKVREGRAKGDTPLGSLRDESPGLKTKAPEPDFDESNPLELWSPEATWKPTGPIQWLIEPVMPIGSVGLLVAYGGSFKSWLAADGCMAIVTGEKWLGRFQAKKGCALMIDFEQGPWELRRRMQRIAHGRGLPTRTVDGQEELVPVEGFRFTSMPSLCLTDNAFYDALLPLAKTYSFIAIDSLAAGSEGINENDAAFAKSLQKLKRIAAKTGCTIVVIHHERKGGDSDDPRKKVRGSGAIYNAVDVALSLSPNGDTFVCKAIKERGPKLVKPFYVRVVDTSPDATEVVTFDKKDGATSTESDAELAVLVVDCVRDNPGIRGAGAVADELKRNRKSVGDIITAKLAEHVLFEEKGPRNSRRLYVKGAEPSAKPN